MLFEMHVVSQQFIANIAMLYSNIGPQGQKQEYHLWFSPSLITLLDLSQNRLISAGLRGQVCTLQIVLFDTSCL